MKKLLLLVLVSIIVKGLSFAGSITVNSPNGGEVWKRGVSKTISWNGSELTNPVKITLWKNGVLVGLIAKDRPASGTYPWTVGAYNGGTAACASDYRIKIREQGGPSFTTEDGSDANFEINGCGGGGTNRFRTSALNVPSKPTAKRQFGPDLKVSRFRDSYTAVTRISQFKSFESEYYQVWIKNDGNRKAVFPSHSTVLVVDIGGIQFKYFTGGGLSVEPGKEKKIYWSLKQKLKKGRRAGTYRMTIRVDPYNVIRESNENNNSKVGQFLLKKPDLVIKSVEAFQNGTRHLLIVVKNKGNLFANFINNPTILHITGRYSPTSIPYYNSISPGRTKLFSLGGLKPKSWGDIKYRLIVDPGNNIDESNEANNRKSFIDIRSK